MPAIYHDGTFGVRQLAAALEGDHLILTAPSLGDVALYPQSADAFFSLGGVPDMKSAADGSSFMAGSMAAKRVK